MSELDWIILAVLLLSVVVGIMRGVVREILAIAGWIVGVILAINFSSQLANLIPLESIGFLPRVIVSSVLIVVATLFVCGLLGTILQKLMNFASITFEDRAMGAVFGVFRGVLIVCTVVFFFGMLESVNQSQYWKESAFITPAQTIIDWSMPLLPDWLKELHQTNQTLY